MRMQREFSTGQVVKLLVNHKPLRAGATGEVIHVYHTVEEPLCVDVVFNKYPQHNVLTLTQEELEILGH